MERIYPCLVNVEFQIRSLEDKAGLGNFKWVPMQQVKGLRSGTYEHPYKEGKRERQGLKVVSSITIPDFDGQHKRTYKTEWFRDDGTYLKEPQYGLHDRGGKKSILFHGRKSCNWIPIPLTAKGIVTFLDRVFSVVPGRFRSPVPADDAAGREHAESQRSEACLDDWDFYLWDHDEWSEEYPACSPEELLCRHPTLRDDFYWGGESISSKSFLKPEWRYRLMSTFGETIDDPHLMDVVIDVITKRYPSIAHGVATDKIHISYGNGRADKYSEIYGGELTSDFLTTLKPEARQRRRDVEEKAAKDAEKAARKRERRRARDNRQAALIDAGIADSDAVHPWTAFTKVPVATLLTDLEWATPLSGDQWNWHESGPGKSFELYDDVIKPFSNSIINATPSGVAEPINGHRFVAYNLWGLDVRNESDGPELYRQLAERGYGQWVDSGVDFSRMTQEQTVTAIRKGVTSPLALKRAPAILEKSDEIDQTVLSTLQENREAIQDAFSRENRIVLLRGDTGVGKDYEKVAWILNFDGKVIESEPTIDLAKEKELDFIKRAGSARGIYRWRGIMSGWGENRERSINERITNPFPDDIESLCIKAPRFNALRSKGANPHKSLCPNCPVYSQCVSHGYRSQIERAKKVDYVITPDRYAFFDPAHEGFVDQLIRGQKVPVGVIDELKVHELFIKCQVKMDELRSIKAMWGDSPLGRFADGLLRALTLNQTPNFGAIREIVQDQREERKIKDSFTKVRLPGRFIEHGVTDMETGRVLADLKFEFDNNKAWTWVANSSDAYEILLEKNEPVVLLCGYSRRDRFANISLDQALALGCFEVDGQDTFDSAGSVECLPRVHPDNWTPFHQLRAFFSTYKRLEDAPIEYSGETLTFYCRPQLHPKLDRLIMMSATLASYVIRDKVFPNVSVAVVDAPPAEWAEGVKVYQIRTGRYPRQSVLQYDDETRDVIGLWQFGQKGVDMFLSEARQNPKKKYAIITYKVVLDLMEEDLQKLPNVVVANYGAAEGENEKYLDADVFWILFAPFLPPEEVKLLAKRIYGADSETLDYTRREEGSYVDRRVQSICDAAVQNELIQAIGRARLVRRENVKVVILTGVYLKGITDRKETVLFDYEDYLIADSLDKLEDVVQKREFDIARIRQMHADGASKADIQEIFGLSYRRVDTILQSEVPS